MLKDATKNIWHKLFLSATVRKIYMHSVSGFSRNWFWRKICIQTIACSFCIYNPLKGCNIISSC